MFKRLILDKEQERLFRSLPKPNLTNLDFNKNVENQSDQGQNNSKSRRGSQLSKNSNSENEENPSSKRNSNLPNNAQDLKNAYESLKKKDDKISQKLLQAFEETLIQVRSRAATRRLSNLKEIKELGNEEDEGGFREMVTSQKDGSVKVKSGGGSDDEEEKIAGSDGE